MKGPDRSQRHREHLAGSIRSANLNAARADWSRQSLALLVVLTSAVVLFWLVNRDSSFLDIDSFPYLSMGFHFATDGKPKSSFDFVGNFDVLPNYVNFIAPGTGVLLGLGTLLTGNVLAAGKAVLVVSLFLTQFFAYLILVRATGQMVYALVASTFVIWHPALAIWATGILSELPFVACLLGSVAAAAVVIGDGSNRSAWTLLIISSALLPLLRYLGIFFPLTFLVFYMARAFHFGAGRKVLLPLLAYEVAVFTPLVLWFALVRFNGSPLFPDRPASQLVLGKALLDATSYLFLWIGPWLVAFSLLFAFLKMSRPQTGLPNVPGETASGFLWSCLVGYLVVLIVVRLQSAFYPLQELGYRYTAPAWPMAGLGAALFVHRFLWSRRTRLVTHATAAFALLIAAWQVLTLISVSFIDPFPTETETYRQALRLMEPDAGILANYGQAFVLPRPRARIVGIPSREDFRYEIDLGDLARRHHLQWLVLFYRPDGDRMYGPWYPLWLKGPPTEVDVQASWRLADGVIYRLAPTQP
ncbi:MAG TPA: hypothetical protein VIE89_08350 [Candidatus Binatia bacterium]|jgi:hypothetical protein